ncbi:MAG: transglutaminase-like domain-containing protein [Clostridiales bacterium]|nr:transglutaminase-like domain-containing protein [Clostridiales bacterium]
MRKASDYAFFLIIGGLMVFALAFNILNATIIPVSIPVIIFGVILFLILFTIVFHNHYTFLATLGFVAAAMLLVLSQWDNSWLNETNATGVSAYFQGLILFIRGYLPYEDTYGPVITLLVCGFLALYMTLSLYVSFQFYFTALLGAGIFIVNSIMDYKRSEISFVLFIFCFCVLMYKKMNNRRRDVNLSAIYMMPVCLLVVASAYFLPPVNRQWDNADTVELLKNPLNNVNDFFYFIFNPKYFSFQVTGFEGRDGRLGGSLTMNNREVMRVKADKPTYLAGVIKDIYTGNAWLTGNLGFTETYSEDLARFEAIETQVNSRLGRDFTIQRLTVNIGDARTGTVFRPMKNRGVEIATDLDLLTDSFGDIRLSDVLPSDSEYSFEYMDIDYSDDTVLSLLRNSHRGFYREGVSADMYADLISSLLGGASAVFNPLDILDFLWEYLEPDQRYIWGVWEYQSRLGSRSMGFDPAGYFNEELIPYADYVYEAFLNLPENLPPRVRNLAEELTASADNAYDRAKAIEEYLAEFPYTLMPGMPPGNRDFVDYFLFDGQEGYCVYYASAMAVLCRCIGLPSRYVEGYIMPASPSEDGYYTVTNLQAHAWAEVYFEGFGWVPFEATAPYSYNFYQLTPPLNHQVFTPEFASDPNYEDYRDHMLNGNDRLPGTDLTPAPASNKPSGTTNAAAALLIASVALLVVFVCFTTLILKGKYDIWRGQARIQKLPRNEQAIEYFREIIKMTRYYRYPMLDYETPAAYAERIGKRFAFKNDSIFIRDLARIYNKAKYAGEQIHREELTLMRNCRDELLAYIRYMRRKPVFIWNRYITRGI